MHYRPNSRPTAIVGLRKPQNITDLKHKLNYFDLLYIVATCTTNPQYATTFEHCGFAVALYTKKCTTNPTNEV